jgi:hypothetical protein
MQVHFHMADQSSIPLQSVPKSEQLLHFGREWPDAECNSSVRKMEQAFVADGITGSAGWATGLQFGETKI